MLGNLPQPNKNPGSEIYKDSSIFPQQMVEYWQEIGQISLRKISDYSSNLIDFLNDLSNTRLIYDGCNAFIAIGQGGLPKFYRNKYCDLPKPTPLGELDYSQCGRVTLFFITGYVNFSQTTFFNIPASQVITNFRRCFGYAELSDYDLVRSIGGEASGQNITLTNGVRITIETRGALVHNGDCSLSNPPFGSVRYPQYYLINQIVSVPSGRADNPTIQLILNQISTTGIPELLKVSASIPAAGCTAPQEIKPPPPPPIKECCMSSCCPDNSNLEALLKLILLRIGEPAKVTIFDEDLDRKGSQKADKTPPNLNEYLKLAVERVEIANRIMGIESFPVTVPQTMIDPYKEGIFGKVFKFIDGKKKIKIGSVTELIAWMAQQDSAVLGEFHQVIEFEGDNKKTSTVVLPNVAESLKEIVLLTSQMARQNNIQTELLFKMAAEVLDARAAATRASKIAEDIQDYLDYPTQTKSQSIKTNISLPRIAKDEKGKPIATNRTENYRNFLKTGEIKFTYDDWTGDNSFHDQMLDLLQLAAMLRAIFYQRTDRG